MLSDSMFDIFEIWKYKKDNKITYRVNAIVTRANYTLYDVCECDIHHDRTLSNSVLKSSAVTILMSIRYIGNMHVKTKTIPTITNVENVTIV